MAPVPNANDAPAIAPAELIDADDVDILPVDVIAPHPIAPVPNTKDVPVIEPADVIVAVPVVDIFPDDDISPVFDIPVVFIELPTVTVPFNAVVDFPDIPIVIGVVPITFDPILIAPVVLVVVVEFVPILRIPDV